MPANTIDGTFNLDETIKYDNRQLTNIEKVFTCWGIDNRIPKSKIANIASINLFRLNMTPPFSEKFNAKNEIKTINCTNVTVLASTSIFGLYIGSIRNPPSGTSEEESLLWCIFWSVRISLFLEP